MTELLKALNQTVESTNLARISVKNIPLMQQAQAGGRAVADYALRRAILLVGITCFAGHRYSSAFAVALEAEVHGRKPFGACSQRFVLTAR